MRHPLTLPRQTVLRPPLSDLPSCERSVITKRLAHDFHGPVVDLWSKSEFLMSPPELTDHGGTDESKYPPSVSGRQ